jgi:predicted NAD-dependent protein-ADP-ribosyltransferase YbiA (DUF1768 family)
VTLRSIQILYFEAWNVRGPWTCFSNFAPLPENVLGSAVVQLINYEYQVRVRRNNKNPHVPGTFRFFVLNLRRLLPGRSVYPTG